MVDPTTGIVVLRGLAIRGNRMKRTSDADSNVGVVKFATGIFWNSDNSGVHAFRDWYGV